MPPHLLPLLYTAGNNLARLIGGTIQQNMARKIIITKAETNDTEITVTFDVYEGDEKISTDSQKYSLKCTEADIERHLKRVLDTESFAQPREDGEQTALDAAAITVEALKNREIIKEDRIK